MYMLLMRNGALYLCLSFPLYIFIAMKANKKPYFVAVLIQIIYAGFLLLTKAAFNGGMNTSLFVFYRQAIATVVLVPFGLLIERKRPPLSFTVFCKIFMLSLLGITLSLNVHGIALDYTSASLAAAISNTLPVITFFIAVLLRIEIVNLKTYSGAAKVLGVVLCVAGAAILGFYKGPLLEPVVHLPQLWHHNTRSAERGNHHQALVSSSNTWIKGVLLMVISNISWGLWLVLQVRVLQSYPSKLLLTTLQCFLSTIQSFIVAVVFNRHTYQWKLHLDVGLIAVAYCGIVVTGIAFYLQAYCIEKRGPVFLAMWAPLLLIITIICSSFILAESVSLGSILGGIVMVGGLYSFLYGKRLDEKYHRKPTTAENGKIEDVETDKNECLEEI